MAQKAAKKLITSKGTVSVGEDLPSGLPAEEVKVIGEAGGIEGYKPGKATADAPQKGGKKPTKAEVKKDAQKAVDEAQGLVDAAATPEDKVTAEGLLKEAQDALAALG